MGVGNDVERLRRRGGAKASCSDQRGADKEKWRAAATTAAPPTRPSPPDDAHSGGSQYRRSYRRLFDIWVTGER